VTAAAVLHVVVSGLATGSIYALVALSLVIISRCGSRCSIGGRKIRTVYYDDGFKPQDAVADTRKLVEQDGVFAAIATQGTAPSLAAVEYLEPNMVPLLFPYQGSPVTRGKKYVFSGMTLYDRQSRMMIDYLAGQRKYKTFATIYQDDEYGKAFLTAFEKDLARHGAKMVASEPIKRGVTDVSAQMAKLRAASPEVTFLVLTPGPGAQALKERQKIGWTDTLLLSSGPLIDERYLALAGEGAAEGVEGLLLWPDPLTSDVPGMKQYRHVMQKYFGKNEPNRYSLAGYFAAMLFVEGARRAGRNLTRESRRARLRVGDRAHRGGGTERHARGRSANSPGVPRPRRAVGVILVADVDER